MVWFRRHVFESRFSLYPAAGLLGLGTLKRQIGVGTTTRKRGCLRCGIDLSVRTITPLTQLSLKTLASPLECKINICRFRLLYFRLQRLAAESMRTSTKSQHTNYTYKRNYKFILIQPMTFCLCTN